MPPNPPAWIEGTSPPSNRLPAENYAADPEGRLAGYDQQGRKGDLAFGRKGSHRDEEEAPVKKTGQDDEEKAEPPLPAWRFSLPIGFGSELGPTRLRSPATRSRRRLI